MKRILTSILAVLVVLGLLSAGTVGAQGSTVVVKPSSMNGWAFSDDGYPGGTGTFVTGPATVPMGAGSVNMKLNATARLIIGTVAYAGTRLDQISSLQYSTNRASVDPGNNLAIALQFDMDYDLTDGNIAWQGRLVYEPYQTPGVGGTITQNTWRTWNPLSGRWWASGAPGNSVCPQSSPCTWAQVLANWPNAGLRANVGVLQFKAGGPWPNFDGSVDSFTISAAGTETTYDFEPETLCATTCYVDGVNGNDTWGGDTPTSAKKTIQAAVNQVSSGGTVLVLPANYTESPNLTKSLTLQSTDGPNVTAMALQSGSTYLGALTISGNTVTVDGFTIVGFDAIGSGLASSNIFLTTTPENVTITNNHIKVGAIGPGSNGDDGFGLITTYNTGDDVQNLSVNDNVFEPLNTTGARAFYINPGVNNFTFSGNVIQGNFMRTAITQAKNGVVEENVVTGTGAPGSRSRGLGTWGYPTPSVYGRTIFRENVITGTAKAISVFETENVRVENNVFAENGNAVWLGTAMPLAFNLSTVSITGNSITANDAQGVVKDSSLTGILNASANWWGTNAPAEVAALVSSGVDYTPWLDIGTDLSPDMGFQGDFATLFVDDDSPQAGSVGRVQEGVNLVTGSTVEILPGVYTEQVEIIKTVTLQGAGSTSIIRSPDVLTKFFTTSAANKPIVYVHDTTNVTIKDLVVDGAGKGNANYRFIGIGFRNADGTISYVEIKDVRNTPFSGAQHGVALYNWSDDGLPHSLTVLDSNFHDFQKNAMALNANDVTPLSVEVRGNTITGYGPTTVTAQNGIQVWADLGTGTVVSNTITGIGYDNTSSATKWVASSILNYYADLEITDNTVSGGHAEIYNIDGDGLIARNRLDVEKIGVSGYGIIATDPPGAVPQPFDVVPSSAAAISEPMLTAAATQNVEVANNEITFSGGDNTDTYGVEADAGYGPSDLSINMHHNIVSGFGRGVEVSQCQEDCDSGAFTNLVANYNSITGNGTGLHSNWTGTVDGSKNWWGSSTGPTNVNNPGGTGDSVSGEIGFVPWLCDGMDTSPDIGFQPNQDYLCPATAAVITITTPVSGTELCFADVYSVTVTVNDAFGNPVQDESASLYASSGELTALSGIPVVATCITDVTGECSFNWVPESLGAQHLLATAGLAQSNRVDVEVKICGSGASQIYLPIVIKETQ